MLKKDKELEFFRQIKNKTFHTPDFLRQISKSSSNILKNNRSITRPFCPKICNLQQSQEERQKQSPNCQHQANYPIFQTKLKGKADEMIIPKLKKYRSHKQKSKNNSFKPKNMLRSQPSDELRNQEKFGLEKIEISVQNCQSKKGTKKQNEILIKTSSNQNLFSHSYCLTFAKKIDKNDGKQSVCDRIKKLKEKLNNSLVLKIMTIGQEMICEKEKKKRTLKILTTNGSGTKRIKTNVMENQYMGGWNNDWDSYRQDDILEFKSIN